MLSPHIRLEAHLNQARLHNTTQVFDFQRPSTLILFPSLNPFSVRAWIKIYTRQTENTELLPEYLFVRKYSINNKPGVLQCCLQHTHTPWVFIKQFALL